MLRRSKQNGHRKCSIIQRIVRDVESGNQGDFPARVGTTERAAGGPLINDEISENKSINLLCSYCDFLFAQFKLSVTYINDFLKNRCSLRTIGTSSCKNIIYNQFFDTDHFSIMSPKYFITLKQPEFQLPTDNYDDNTLALFITVLLIASKLKWVDYLLHNQRLNFLEYSDFSNF